jgi:hypothetical protein
MKRGRDRDDPPAFPALPTWAGNPALEEKGTSQKFEPPVPTTEAFKRPERWDGAAPPPSPWESKPSSSWRSGKSQPRNYNRDESLVEPEPDPSWVEPPPRKPARSSSRPWRMRGSRVRWYKPIVAFFLIAAVATGFWLLVPAEAWDGLAKGADRIWASVTDPIIQQIEAWRGKKTKSAPVAVSRPEGRSGSDPAAADEQPAPARRAKATVTLLTEPSGANVIGRRGLLGITPYAYTGREGASETITFTLDGYLPVSRKIVVGRKRPSEITIELVPNGKPAVEQKFTPPPKPPSTPAPAKTP